MSDVVLVGLGWNTIDVTKNIIALCHQHLPSSVVFPSLSVFGYEYCLCIISH